MAKTIFDVDGLVGVSLLLTGVGHLATEVFAPNGPERVAMLAVMRSWHVSLPGTERDVAELMFGFSLLMGLLLVRAGAVIATAHPTRWSRRIVVALTLGISAAAWRYFFAVPGVLTSIAAAAAIKAWWDGRKSLVQRA